MLLKTLFIPVKHKTLHSYNDLFIPVKYKTDTDAMIYFS